MENSKIGWTHHTWNPWRGCNKVSEACRHCYIGPIMRRSGSEPFHGPMKTKTTWHAPFTWNREATDNHERYRVFTCSMSDFFHPGADQWRSDAWEVIKACQNLDWLILTKRPELIDDRLPSDWEDGYRNVWLGVTVESQDYVPRVDVLAKIPAANPLCLCRTAPWTDQVRPPTPQDRLGYHWLRKSGEVQAPRNADGLGSQHPRSMRRYWHDAVPQAALLWDSDCP